jgi:hypothetical protein
MNKIALVLFIITITSSLFAKTQVFKEYNFSEDGFTLLFVQNQPYLVDQNNNSSDLINYYTDDISILNNIKNNWIFSKSEVMYACGYSFTIYLCKNKKIIDTFYINLDCEQICTKLGCYSFNKNYFFKIQNSLTKAITKSDKFSTLEKGRKIQADYIKLNNLITTDLPDWLKYEGEFDFQYLCLKDDGNCFINNHKILNKLQDQIKSNYPDQSCFLEIVGYNSPNELECRVKCNLQLAKQFNIYKIINSFQAYNDFVLISYWKI